MPGFFARKKEAADLTAPFADLINRQMTVLSFQDLKDAI